MEEHRFTLFVAGDGELTVRALANFERIIRPRLRGGCVITTVDVLREPGAARKNRVVATPLLIKECPLPVVKILGDLSHEERILIQLGLDRVAAEIEQPEGRVEKENEK